MFQPSSILSTDYRTGEQSNFESCDVIGWKKGSRSKCHHTILCRARRNLEGFSLSSFWSKSLPPQGVMVEVHWENSSTLENGVYFLLWCWSFLWIAFFEIQWRYLLLNESNQILRLKNGMNGSPSVLPIWWALSSLV